MELMSPWDREEIVMEEMVYKAANNYGNHYCSIAAPRWCKTRYEIGKISVPRIGYLMAFDTLENALHFCNRFCGGARGWIILEGLGVVEPLEIKWLVAGSEIYEEELVERFWEDPVENVPGQFMIVPTGTVFLSSFLPKKIVTEH